MATKLFYCEQKEQVMKGYKTVLLILILINSPVLTAFAQSQPVYLIRGTVQDDSGHYMSGVSVCAFPENLRPSKGVLCARTDATGRFIIRLEEAGKYEIIPAKESEGYISQRLVFYRPPQNSVREIYLDEANADVFISINMGQKNGFLTGKAIDALTNLPIDNIELTMCHADNPLVDDQTTTNNRLKAGDKAFFATYIKDGQVFVDFVEPYFESIDHLDKLR